MNGDLGEQGWLRRFSAVKLRMLFIGKKEMPTRGEIEGVLGGSTSV
jgi:hypothetical protein